MAQVTQLSGYVIIILRFQCRGDLHCNHTIHLCKISVPRHDFDFATDFA